MVLLVGCCLLARSRLLFQVGGSCIPSAPLALLCTQLVLAVHFQLGTKQTRLALEPLCLPLLLLSTVGLAATRNPFAVAHRRGSFHVPLSVGSTLRSPFRLGPAACFAPSSGLELPFLRL